MTAGYDPADTLRDHEQREYDWELTRPVCRACGDRILDEDRFDIGGNKVCEDCINTAWSVIQKNAHRLFFEAYGDDRDGYLVIEAIIEHILETFEIGDFKRETREEND